jgi:hypothetical protein
MIDTTGWPDAYIDDDGHAHAWTDVVPPGPDVPGSETPGPSPYTYADLIADHAGAQGLSVTEYFDIVGSGDEWEDSGFESSDDDL